MSTRVSLKRQPTAPPFRKTEGMGTARPAVIQRALETPGRPLDAVTRKQMEGRLGHHFAEMAVTPLARAEHPTPIVAPNDRTEREADAAAATLKQNAVISDKTPRADFSRVRIHTDTTAQTSARALHARAFTVGRDIFFEAGQYAPFTNTGQALLAHELTHVLQAERGNTAAVIQRKEASKSLPIGDALQVALDGDDDATRDLTNNPDWDKVVVNAPQSATLLIHLLDGITGDDDEVAGLKILNKDVDLKIFDDTLDSLNTRGRFGQLLDDYDGSEYRDLLSVLSNNISTQKMRARYLDAFIAMTWVREHEERAIVYLLERTPDTDRAELLQPKFREEGLRDAIDTADVSVRYEETVWKAFGERAKKVSTDRVMWTNGLFDADAKKCMRQGMAREQADDLLQKALTDIQREVAHDVLDYSDKVLHETIRPFGDPDPDKLAEINRNFRKRMDTLLQRKRAEFCRELKWGVEFNRNLDEVSGTDWTDKDFDAMDKILQAIPDEILHAHPQFGTFRREQKRPGHPRLAGETAGTQITLLQDLTLSTTAHELGHIVHGLDAQMFTNFMAISGWQDLDADAIDKLRKGEKKTDKDFDPLLARLDEKRKKGGDSRAECGQDYKDGFFYLFNRYGEGYFRYPSKLADGKKFVSDYAGTHPRDDFAETFAEYFTDIKRLQSKPFAEKFKFMQLEVFVKFWMKQQFGRVHDEMEQVFRATLNKYPSQNSFVVTIRDDWVQKLWDKYYDLLNDLPKKRAEDVEKNKFNTPLPLKGSTEVRDATGGLLTAAKDLMALADRIIKPQANYGSVLAGAFLDLDKAKESAFKDMTDRLTSELESELWAEFSPPAERIVKGEHIVKDKWTEVDKIAADMEHVLDTLESYLDLYGGLLEAHNELRRVILAGMRKYPMHSTQQTSFRTFAMPRFKRYETDMERARALVRAGTPFDPKSFGNPQTELVKDKKEIEAHAKTLKP